MPNTPGRVIGCAASVSSARPSARVFTLPSVSALSASVAAARLDYHVTGGNVAGLDHAVTPTSSDYAFTYDYDNGSRTPGSRDVGADER